MNSSHGIGMTSQRTRDRLVRRLRAKGIHDPKVLDAIARTPRHLFMDEALSSRAYEDTALPIGFGQTISQPYIVARMTEALIAERIPERVLEIGTGCGYQTAVLAGLVPKVYTVERIASLLEQARRRLRDLGVRNVRYRHGDGTEGWPEYAPYDGILVAAAPEEIPPALLEQLAVGGRLVIPAGPPGGQWLLEVVRTPEGYESRTLGAVSFVPMRGGAEP
ncbi:protein-L-isoaspartate O-methyltransferase [bacterium BMS3Bbin12]|nr:protein-L-isoaspartate O-methyltransferase [bacterium BMS3Abin12]GBE47407.1 protein-L-isoaspartate O-methyltransferase [bacterium BMS3Bbin12]GBE50864.1 protein-L-isoaspartate O-methyltransferase [bacterium BMS3Bbin13]HDO33901.1 protein-L-isoaspartate(D-aspartate) O-methyltransferase [Chromatiales bacterium]